MGLSVKVYQNCELVEEGDENADFMAYVPYENWEYKIKNLKKGHYYRGDLVLRGVDYAYSMHSKFRKSLLVLTGREDLIDENGEIKWNELSPEVPFYELINFSDCEGCLDHDVSAHLFSEFVTYEPLVEGFDGDKLVHNFKQYYDEWLKTFEFGEFGGVVVFM